jgi:hypothetical protein
MTSSTSVWSMECEINEMKWKMACRERHLVLEGLTWKKLSSETPFNSGVQIYQHFWVTHCPHLQGSFTLVLKMEVPQSSEILVITYGIAHKSGIRVFINNKVQTLFKFPIKHNVRISSFSICSTDRYIPPNWWYERAPTRLPSCPVQLDIYVTAPAGLLLLPEANNIKKNASCQNLSHCCATT